MGQYLLDHPKISNLAFTGSTEVGTDVALAAEKKICYAGSRIFVQDTFYDKFVDTYDLSV